MQKWYELLITNGENGISTLKKTVKRWRVIHHIDRLSFYRLKTVDLFMKFVEQEKPQLLEYKDIVLISLYDIDTIKANIDKVILILKNHNITIFECTNRNEIEYRSFILNVEKGVILVDRRCEYEYEPSSIEHEYKYSCSEFAYERSWANKNYSWTFDPQ